MLLFTNLKSINLLNQETLIPMASADLLVKEMSKHLSLKCYSKLEFFFAELLITC